MHTRHFTVIKVIEDRPHHYAVWNEKFFGAVAGRFISKESAKALCNRLNDGEIPDYNCRGIADCAVLPNDSG